MTVSVINLEPQEGLRINPNGGFIQRTGSNERFTQISARTVPTGTKVGTVALDILSVKQVFVGINLSDLGSHTVVTLTFEVSDDASTWYPIKVGSVTSGVISHVIAAGYILTATGKLGMTIMNPSARYFRVTHVGNHVSNSGLIAFDFLRSWGERELIIG